VQRAATQRGRSWPWSPAPRRCAASAACAWTYRLTYALFGGILNGLLPGAIQPDSTTFCGTWPCWRCSTGRRRSLVVPTAGLGPIWAHRLGLATCHLIPAPVIRLRGMSFDLAMGACCRLPTCRCHPGPSASAGLLQRLGPGHRGGSRRMPEAAWYSTASGCWAITSSRLMGGAEEPAVRGPAAGHHGRIGLPSSASRRDGGSLQAIRGSGHW
jgi:hypothetical protein